MHISYIKKYLILLILWNFFIYVSVDLVYGIYGMLPLQAAIGILAGKVIARRNQKQILLLSTIVAPVSVLAIYLPDSSNGLVLLYSWYSAIGFLVGVGIWSIFVKFKSLTKQCF